MILTGDEIRRQIGTDIVLDPFFPERLNPNSYNLSLHHELLVYEEVVLDLRSANRFRRVEIPPEGLVLKPGLIYLGRTVERTETRNLVPRIEARSSIRRLGIHLCAGFGDVGYCGYWTLEMHTVQPVRIYAGVPICQIYYFQVVGNVIDYCSDKYQHNCDVQPSLFYRELGGKESDGQLELDFESLVSGVSR
jgi:dCTP deaminase